ncbi:MAG: flagellar hook-associated protein 3 [Spirochaetales bacterium]|nr:flagellar hook-associated protein 3 [Spirochaetales bacterium]
MRRISTNMTNNDMQNSLRLSEWRMNKLQNQMADGTRIQELRDDPIGAAHSTRYLSKITRLNRFSKNVDSIQSDHRIAEGYMQSATDILHRVREISIQGANGTYSKEDKGYMAAEVNQLLNELVSLSNAENGDGRTIFAGDRTQSEAFRAMKGHIPGVEASVITQVNYTGTIEPGMVEVSEGSFMETSFAGNEVFWAEHQQIFSSQDAGSYQVLEDSQILIDGRTIDVMAGDNVQAVISKINTSGAAVKASLDPVNNSMVLESTVPHQLWLEDGGNGTVLRDLGIIDDFSKPPQNLAKSVRSAGGSMFDMVIKVRDSLYAGDTLDIGGGALKGIDLAMNNLLSNIGKLGAQDERLGIIKSRIAYEIPEVQQKNSNEVDVDFTSAITNLKQLEYNNKAALQTAGRILQQTLLDFLR